MTAVVEHDRAGRVHLVVDDKRASQGALHVDASAARVADGRTIQRGLGEAPGARGIRPLES